MGDLNQEAAALFRQGCGELHTNRSADAMNSLRAAGELYLQLGNQLMYIRCLNAMGSAYETTGNRTAAIDCFLAALKYCDENKVVGCQHLMLNNIANTYIFLEDYPQAIRYLFMAEEMILTKGDGYQSPDSWLICIYLNLGLCFLRSGDYVKSEEYLNLCEKHMTESGDYDYHYPLLITRAKLQASQGNADYIEAHMDELLQYTKHQNENTQDFLMDISELIDLFDLVGETEPMKNLIEEFRAIAGAQDNPEYHLQLARHEMRYARSVGDEHLYRRACVHYADAAILREKETTRSQLNAINGQIELFHTKNAFASVNKKAEYDPLTKLKNRYAMDKFGSAELLRAKAGGTALAVGVLDIDYFKHYNDTYGHLEGDEVLKRIAQILKDATDGFGEVFRLGGDEFVIIIGDASSILAERIARSIRVHLRNSELFEMTRQDGGITISQGYYVAVPQEDQTLNDFIDRADTALYRVKENGRDNYLIRS